jgi:hypothetical protein
MREQTVETIAMNDCGLVHQEIYFHFEVRIYPDSPKEKEVKFKWKDILGENPPEAFKARDSEVISALILSSITNLSKIPSSIRLGQELGTGSHNS